MKTADLLALAAIALWASLAALGVALSHLPPFLLSGLGLLVGSLIALPLSGWRIAAWRVPARTLALGVYGLFGFHFLLFMALRQAPPLQANLVNYLWPLGMVLMAPWLLPGVRFHWRYVGAALLGFAGAAIAIVSRPGAGAGAAGWHAGYFFSLASAFVWASYSLLTQRVAAFPSAAVGGFAALSGALVAALGLGPLGGAFFLWDAALKRGDARRIGLLAFLTPLLSTAVLIAAQGQRASPSLALALALIVGAALWGERPWRRGASPG
jgi:drug/metabolite transporter (DMT)-like permease